MLRSEWVVFFPVSVSEWFFGTRIYLGWRNKAVPRVLGTLNS